MSSALAGGFLSTVQVSHLLVLIKMCRGQDSNPGVLHPESVSPPVSIFLIHEGPQVVNKLHLQCQLMLVGSSYPDLC